MRFFKVKISLIIAGGILAVSLPFASSVNAQPARGQGIDTTPTPITTEVVIPGSPVEKAVEGFFRGKVGDLAGYIEIIYNFLISIVGLVAGVMIMIGGFQYLTAGGDASRVSAAKTRIGNALIGLVLAMGSYLLLNTINPNLVKFEVPRLSPVRTELSFLPFCDKLAEMLNIDESSQIINASARSTPSCGNAGFYETTITDNKGAETKSRLWCVFRGVRRTDDRIDSSYADYGCWDEGVDNAGGIIFDGNWKALSICMPKSGIKPEDLDKEYEKNRRIRDSLGKCSTCHTMSHGRMQALGLPIGDTACEVWQNVANNGDPMNANFKLSQKGIIQDSRVTSKGDDRSKRMYYCGYSAEKKHCVYVPILCHRITTCYGYESMAVHYCQESGRAEMECHGSQTLGSKAFKQTGNVRHIMPVCTGNPCEVPGGCTVPGLAGVQGATGLGSSLRVGVRIATAGIAGTVDCKPGK